LNKTPVIAIFDIGKTNKKLFLFDEAYRIVTEKTKQMEEIKDEDGDSCEDITALTEWVKSSIDDVMNTAGVAVTAMNFSAYGASFVHIGDNGKPVAPLYNYLKPFPQNLQQSFYQQYGGEASFSIDTASPVLGNLNSGLQLYYLKHLKPAVFKKTKYSLHLPQYISWLVTGRAYSDITSIGCHTGLWHFRKNHYHEWIYKENIHAKLAAVFPSDQLMQTSWNGKPLLCGAGLHDSSAALIPYSSGFDEPFVLLSTGTWCISLNPFNQDLLTAEELQQDCLCYMEYRGKAVKASRLFAGNEHEQEIKKIAAYFNVSENYFTNIVFDESIARKLAVAGSTHTNLRVAGQIMQQSIFGKRNLHDFPNYTEAYHQLMLDIMELQSASTKLVLKNSSVKRIFVDGGFGKNPVYMHLLAAAFPQIEVYAASVVQASAIGAALAVNHYWNESNTPRQMAELKLYRSSCI
jgi:sugar (pentulose or hexulose) kinase